MACLSQYREWANLLILFFLFIWLYISQINHWDSLLFVNFRNSCSTKEAVLKCILLQVFSVLFDWINFSFYSFFGLFFPRKVHWIILIKVKQFILLRIRLFIGNNWELFDCCLLLHESTRYISIFVLVVLNLSNLNWLFSIEASISVA